MASHRRLSYVILALIVITACNRLVRGRLTLRPANSTNVM